MRLLFFCVVTALAGRHPTIDRDQARSLRGLNGTALPLVTNKTLARQKVDSAC